MTIKNINLSANDTLKANGACVFGVWKIRPNTKHQQFNVCSSKECTLEIPEFLLKIQEERKLNK